jgi:hypothetical protein
VSKAYGQQIYTTIYKNTTYIIWERYIQNPKIVKSKYRDNLPQYKSIQNQTPQNSKHLFRLWHCEP